MANHSEIRPGASGGTKKGPSLLNDLAKLELQTNVPTMTNNHGPRILSIQPKLKKLNQCKQLKGPSYRL
jgi:hypothetical protein